MVLHLKGSEQKNVVTSTAMHQMVAGVAVGASRIIEFQRRANRWNLVGTYLTIPLIPCVRDNWFQTSELLITHLKAIQQVLFE